MASPRKTPVYSESPTKLVMRNGVEVPNLGTGADDDLGGFNSPSPRAPIRTDAEVSPLQLTKKKKSKEEQPTTQQGDSETTKVTALYTP